MTLDNVLDFVQKNSDRLVLSKLNELGPRMAEHVWSTLFPDTEQLEALIRTDSMMVEVSTCVGDFRINRNALETAARKFERRIEV